MRVRRHGRPLLWLLLPTLLAQGVIATTSAEDSHLSSLARRATDATEYDELALAGSSKPPTDTPNRDIGTKDAPVDGRDGKPHAGPWVGKDAPDSTNGKKKKKPAAGGTDEKVPAAVSRLEKEGYADAVADDGVVPEKNDGVMDDPARKAPEQGTTGTEGGVSERNKKQKMKEEKTGEKSERKPKAPKEAPPLPHSEEEKIKESNAKSGKDVVGEEVVPEKPKGAQGLEVRFSLLYLIYGSSLTISYRDQLIYRRHRREELRRTALEHLPRPASISSTRCPSPKARSALSKRHRQRRQTRAPPPPRPLPPARRTKVSSNRSTPSSSPWS